MSHPNPATPPSMELIPIQRLTALGLRAFATLFAFALLAGSITGWSMVVIWEELLRAQSAYFSGLGSAIALYLAAGLSQLFLLGSGGWWIALQWRRADAMAELIDLDYPAITAFAQGIRVCGELCALICLQITVIGALMGLLGALPWVADLSVHLSGGTISKVSGVAIALTVTLSLAWLLAGGLAAAAALYLAYLFAEGLSAMIALFRDLRLIRERLEREPVRAEGRASSAERFDSEVGC